MSNGVAVKFWQSEGAIVPYTKVMKFVYNGIESITISIFSEF